MAPWVVFLIAATLSMTSGLKVLEVIYDWSQPDFEFPENNPQVTAEIQSGRYNTTQNILIDADRDSRGRYFVTFPNMLGGWRPTVALVTNRTDSDGKALLQAYPDVSFHLSDTSPCDSLISVFRIQIDKCNRLWVIDSGVVEFVTNATQRCPPKLMAFDLNTDALLLRYEIPERDLRPNYLLATVVADSCVSCDEAVVYIADVYGYGMIVYKYPENRSYLTVAASMYPYPHMARIRVGDVAFTRLGGILGMAIKSHDGESCTLYHQSMVSDRISHVNTSVVVNEDNFRRNDGVTLVEDEFFIPEGRRKSQSIALAISKGGYCFFQTLYDNRVNVWNTRTPFSECNMHVVDHDDVLLQFVTGAKIVTNENDEEELIMCPTRYHRVYTRTLNVSDVNFRIVKAPVKALLAQLLK